MKKGINTSTSSSAVMNIQRPKGVPRAEWREMTRGEKARTVKNPRFLDFSISTNKYTGGNEQYGVGQTMRSRNARSVRAINATVDPGYQNRGQGVPESGLVRTTQSSVQNKTIVLSEREMFSVIATAGAPYEVQSFQVNPGLSTFMPKGSKVAMNFERYKWRRLRVAFIPTVSGFAPEGQQGRIGLAAKFNASSAAPSSLVAAEELDPHVSGMPNERIELVLDASRLNAASMVKYVRSGPNPAGTDIKLYDALSLHFFSSGLGASGQIGELHVEYEVECYNIADNTSPQLPPNNWKSLFISNHTNSSPNVAIYPSPAGGGAFASMPGWDNSTTGIVPATDANGVSVLSVPTGNFVVRVTYSAASGSTFNYVGAGFATSTGNAVPYPAVNPLLGLNGSFVSWPYLSTSTYSNNLAGLSVTFPLSNPTAGLYLLSVVWIANWTTSTIQCIAVVEITAV